MRSRALVLPLLLAIPLVGCDDLPDAADAGPADASHTDASPADASSADAGPATSDGGPGCALTSCGGECVDVETDERHCGACDSPCVAPTDGTASCEAGGCAITCDEGFAPRGDGCAPRPPAPTSDLDGDGLADAVVGSYGTVSVFTTTPGMSELSPDQTFRSPSGSDPNFGTTIALLGDVDGDGRGEVAVMSGGRGHVYVYRGTIGGIDATNPTELLGCTSSRDTCDGYRLSAAGDVDRDGHADLLITRTTTVDFRQVETTYLHLGGPGGISTTATQTWPDHTVTSAGDVDGDGDADLLTWPDIGRLAWIESDGGSYTETPLVLPARFNLRHVVPNADVNGDGYADVAVLDAGGSEPGVVWWRGSPDGLVDAPEGRIPLRAGAAFWEWGSLARGDFDGDGYDDIVASQETDASGSPDPIQIRILFGGPDGLDGARERVFERSSSDWGVPIVGVGDTDGDGYGDFVVGARGSGPIELLRGGPRDVVPALGPRLDAPGNRAGIALGVPL